MTYTYRHIEPDLWAVGTWDDGGNWLLESTHHSFREAAVRIQTLDDGHHSPRPETTEPYAPTRFDRLLAAAFQGILANRELSDTRAAYLALDHTKALMKLLKEQDL